MAMSSATPAVTASASSENSNNASTSSAMVSPSQNNQQPVSSEDSKGALSHTSPASVLELETSASNTKGNATDLITDECVEVSNAEISLVELQIPNDLGLMAELQWLQQLEELRAGDLREGGWWLRDIEMREAGCVG